MNAHPSGVRQGVVSNVQRLWVFSHAAFALLSYHGPGTLSGPGVCYGAARPEFSPVFQRDVTSLFVPIGYCASPTPRIYLPARSHMVDGSSSWLGSQSCIRYLIQGQGSPWQISYGLRVSYRIK